MGKINSRAKGARNSEEIWKPVVGYEGHYEVSNLGRIKSVERRTRFVSKNGKECTRRVRERIIQGTEHCIDGRISVMLSKGNEKKRIAVHRLVAKAFCDNPHGYTEINHIDENPRNNRADNLEWCTRDYNMHYGTIQERVYDKMKRPIRAVSVQGDEVRFNSISAAERLKFVKVSILKSIRTGCIYRGFYWEYDDDKQQTEG